MRTLSKILSACAIVALAGSAAWAASTPRVTMASLRWCAIPPVNAPLYQMVR